VELEEQRLEGLGRTVLEQEMESKCFGLGKDFDS